MDIFYRQAKEMAAHVTKRNSSVFSGEDACSDSIISAIKKHCSQQEDDATVADNDMTSDVAAVSDKDTTTDVAPVSDTEVTSDVAAVSDKDMTTDVAPVSDTEVTSDVAAVTGYDMTTYETTVADTEVTSDVVTNNATDNDIAYHDVGDDGATGEGNEVAYEYELDFTTSSDDDVENPEDPEYVPSGDENEHDVNSSPESRRMFNAAASAANDDFTAEELMKQMRTVSGPRIRRPSGESHQSFYIDDDSLGPKIFTVFQGSLSEGVYLYNDDRLTRKSEGVPYRGRRIYIKQWKKSSSESNSRGCMLD